MKSSKRPRSPPRPEECGVWLDASQLKKKCHQVVFPCTSSRFHPLARRQPTDSVLVEFTQTKSPPPGTKQTSMYSFFSPAGIRNKPSCITDININESSTECDKRNVQEVWKKMKSSSTGSCVCLKQTNSEPAENQETICFYKLHSNAEKPVRSGQNENDERSCVLEKRNDDSSSGFPCDLKSEALEKTTDYGATGSGSKYQNNLSDSSVSKCLLEDSSKEDHFLPSQSESQLFTQDTQGNRVISHRFTSGHRNHAPLQDKTNVNWDARSPMKGTRTLCEEDSLYKMFTEDSEGNMVMKH